jgi:hypothetical protein
MSTSLRSSPPTLTGKLLKVKFVIAEQEHDGDCEDPQNEQTVMYNEVSIISIPSYLKPEHFDKRDRLYPPTLLYQLTEISRCGDCLCQKTRVPVSGKLVSGKIEKTKQIGKKTVVSGWSANL